VFEVLEEASVQNTYEYVFSPLCTRLSRLRLLLQMKFPSEAVSYFSIFAVLLALKYKNKEHIFGLVVEIKPNFMTK